MRADSFVLDDAAAGIESADIDIPQQAREAIAWSVRLSSGEATSSDIRSFETWLHRSPANSEAWSEVSESILPLGLVGMRQEHSGAFAERALRKGASRRAVVAGLSALVAVPALAALADRFVPITDLTADKFTLTGQTETVRLPDGSTIVIGARSAVDLTFDASTRRVGLRKGVVKLASRPAEPLFSIEAGPLTLVADAGSFVARRGPSQILMTAIDRPALVTLGTGEARIEAGQSAFYEAGRIAVRKASVETETSWVDGLLDVQDQSVSFVVSRLRPYFPGLITVATDVEADKVTGVFPLSDVGRAVDLLADALDLSVSRATPYWIALSAKAGRAA